MCLHLRCPLDPLIHATRIQYAEWIKAGLDAVVQLIKHRVEWLENRYTQARFFGCTNQICMPANFLQRVADGSLAGIRCWLNGEPNLAATPIEKMLNINERIGN